MSVKRLHLQSATHHAEAQRWYPVQVRQLLMADQSVLVGELSPAQQTGHLLPVSQLVVLLFGLARLTAFVGLLFIFFHLFVASSCVVRRQQAQRTHQTLEMQNITNDQSASHHYDKLLNTLTFDFSSFFAGARGFLKGSSVPEI